MLTTRIIPQNQEVLITLAELSLSGLQSLGVTLGVAQNTALGTAGDLHDLVGEPGAGTEVGKVALLATARLALTNARAARRIVVTAGHKFCGNAVDQLKLVFGRKWNPQWAGAGFSQSTIALNRRNPLPVLLELRNYFRENPTQENAPLGITATAADTAVTSINNAEQAVTAAITTRSMASAAVLASRKQLRARLRALRDELTLLLGPEDARWQQFGFSRPVGIRLPEPVSGLIATPGLPGQVLLSHEASARALDYRVSWLLNTSGAEPTVVGLFADLATLLTGLPSGANIIVQVTARNEAGETQPAAVTITVP